MSHRNSEMKQLHQLLGMLIRAAGFCSEKGSFLKHANHFVRSQLGDDGPEERVRVLLVDLEHLEGHAALVQVRVERADDQRVHDRRLGVLHRLGILET